ncbi:MAG TPA: GNAT family N-acetyltransferase [Parafilimonas sp.]|nr:GNAT family N-acetyltransferase [Parafilimonas sp.]
MRIRKAMPEDALFIAQHAHCMLDFKLPDWRANEKDIMVKADINHLTKALQASDGNDAMFIAEDESNKPLGFVRVNMQTDYFTGEEHAHVNDIVVTKDAEGKGAGKLLLTKADEWAKEKNARWITLNVFDENFRARKVYEKAGYKIEWIKYLKIL